MGLFAQNTQGGLMRYFTDPGKYVKDFRIEETTDSKGRVRKNAVYIGPWTDLRDRETSAKPKLWITLILSVILATAYVRMLLLTHLMGSRLEVMIPLLLGLFPVLYLLMGALSLPFRGKPMRRDQYMHSFIRVSRSCAAIAVFCLLGLVITLILRAVWGDWSFFPEDWVFIACCAVLPLLCVAIIFLVRSINVTEKENAAFSGTVR